MLSKFKAINSIFSISISFFTFIHFFSLIYNNNFLLIILVISGLIILITGFLILPPNEIVLPLFLVFVSFTINLIYNNFHIGFSNSGILKMEFIISLLCVIPMISWVLEEESYFKSIMYSLHKYIKNSITFYISIMLATMLISFFLLFGSVSVVYEFQSEILKKYNNKTWEYYKSTSLVRGFALTKLWVISNPSLAYIISISGASLWISILQGIFLSFFSIILAVCMMYLKIKKTDEKITKIINNQVAQLLTQRDTNISTKKLTFEFIILFVSLVCTIFAIYPLVHNNLLTVISLSIIVWTLLYFIFKKRLKRFVYLIKDHISYSLSKNIKQFLLLFSAGLVIKSLEDSGLFEKFTTFIFQIEESISIINILWFLPFILIILSFTGVGPLTSIILIGSVFQNINFPHPPELIVLSVSSGSVISVLISPFVISIIFISEVNGLSVFKNGLKFNLLYSLFFYILIQTYLQVITIYFN